MMSFNIIFGAAMVMVLVMLHVMRTYTSLMHSTMSIAEIPAVGYALQENSHHLHSKARAMSEYRLNTRFWLPLIWTNVVVLVYYWWIGYQAGGSLEYEQTMAIALLLTPIVAHRFTSNTDVGWLLSWTAGIQAVFLSIQMQAVATRIAEIEAMEEVDSTVLKEQEYLAQVFERMEAVMQIQVGSQQPADSE